MDRNVDPEWYRKVFTLKTKDMPWADGIVEETGALLDMLELSGGESILDLGCGFGHHALELARRGFQVVGVDLSSELIAYAREEAARRKLAVEFICADLREVTLGRQFDVVLSLFDGAIGYFENEEENMKTFQVISACLRAGGRHLMQIPNVEHARRHYPLRTWCSGRKMVELLEYDWDESSRLLYASTQPLAYGESFQGWQPIRTRQRLYEVAELRTLLAPLGMSIQRTFRVLEKATPGNEDEYISVISTKE